MDKINESSNSTDNSEKEIDATHDLIYSWLERISTKRAPSGIEDERREAIADIVLREIKIKDPKEEKGKAEMSIDRLGNLLVKFNPGVDKPKIVFFAHMDEIGLTVRKILPNGYILVSKRGGIDGNWLVSRRVLILTSDNKWIQGVIPGKSLHSIPPEKRKTKPNIFELKVFIGATSKKAVEKLGIHVGAPAVIDEKFGYLNGDIDRNIIVGHSLDNLLAIAHNLLFIKKLRSLTSEEISEINAQIIFAFTVREEIGCSGGRFVLKTEEPDIAIAIEVGILEESKGAIENGATLKGGPMIIWQEASGTHIFDYQLCSEFRDVAKKFDIPVQHGVFQFYGSGEVVKREIFLIFIALNLHCVLFHLILKQNPIR